MSDEQEYTIYRSETANMVKRQGRAAGIAEGWYDGESDETPHPLQDTSNVTVQVTGPAVTFAGGTGTDDTTGAIYPGVIVWRNVYSPDATSRWLYTKQIVYVQGLNDDLLTTKKYKGLVVDTFKGLPLVIVDVGGTDLVMLRVTAYPLTDVTNPRDFWPSLIQSYDPTRFIVPFGDYEDTDSTLTLPGDYIGGAGNPLNAWIINPMQYFATGGGLDTTFAGDGSSYRICRPTGWNYNPYTGLTYDNHTSNSQYVLPIFDTTQYSALINAACLVDGTIGGESGS